MDKKSENKKLQMFLFIATAAIIIASILLFNFRLQDYLGARIFGAQIFEGMVDNEGNIYGICLEDGEHYDEDGNDLCEDIEDCDGVDAEDTRCISQAEIGTGVSKSNINETGLAHTDNMGVLLVKYVNFTLPYLALAAFIAFVVAGFFYVTAFGNEEQLQKSKKIMIYAAAGLIIVISSFAIVQFLAKELVESLAPMPPDA